VKLTSLVEHGLEEVALAPARRPPARSVLVFRRRLSCPGSSRLGCPLALYSSHHNERKRAKRYHLARGRAYRSLHAERPHDWLS
jgi:hypothetical protein